MHYASGRTTFRSAPFKTYFEGKFVQTHNQTKCKCLPKFVYIDNAYSKNGWCWLDKKGDPPLDGSPFCDGRVTLPARPTFLPINALARPAESTPSRRDNKSMGERCWLGQRLGKRGSYRVFWLTRPAAMKIYWNKGKRLRKKRVQLPQDWFRTPAMAAVLFFWDAKIRLRFARSTIPEEKWGLLVVYTNMAAVTSCEKTCWSWLVLVVDSFIRGNFSPYNAAWGLTVSTVKLKL